MIDALFCFDEITILCRENIGHVFLRIAIDQREPGALDLDHDPVAFSEPVVDIMQIYGECFGPVRC